MPRVHVVSDVHGRAEAIRAAGDGADALICLGDLILFMDYADHSDGIMGGLFGAEAVGTYVALRDARDFDAARVWSQSLWKSLGRPTGDVIDDAVHEQYREIFDAFPTPTYLTYGNVDLPALMREHVRDGVEMLDGQVVEIEGRTFGFVGGGLVTPMRTPTEISVEEYDAKLAAIEGVDVVCSHIPPHLPGLVYDTVAQRFERGSAGLLRLIRRSRPAYVLHGHVHQPLAHTWQVDGTRVVNVGHFRATREPYALVW